MFESSQRRVPTHVLMFTWAQQSVNHMLLCSGYVPLRMLRLSFPQKASRRGSSPLTSSPAAGLSSGELGPRLRSSGALVHIGGGEDTPGACGRLGERVAVGGGEERPQGALVELGGGEEMEGLWLEVGELAAEEEGVADRSRTPTLPPIGELSESLRQCTGEEVREGMERGGGEENLRHSLGDLLFRGSVAHEPWLVAKKSSRDLKKRDEMRADIAPRRRQTP